MSNKEPLTPEQKFADWLDGKSADDGDEASELWQQREQTARLIQHQVELSGEQPVPHWDRAAAFSREKTPFWQWQGLSALSMAFSMFAIALVLFKVELEFQNGGLLLSFSGSNTAAQDARVEAMVEQKLQSFAQEQQVVLANYAADISTKQQDNNLQLASYIIGASREERQEDISDFIQYINEQRKDERLEQQLKNQQFEQAIKYRNSYQSKYVDGIGLNQEAEKTTPVNWNSEE